MTETHRKAFEQWAAKEGFRMTKRGNGDYVAPFTSIAWRAWQEAVKQNAGQKESREVKE